MKRHLLAGILAATVLLGAGPSQAVTNYVHVPTRHLSTLYVAGATTLATGGTFVGYINGYSCTLGINILDASSYISSDLFRGHTSSNSAHYYGTMHGSVIGSLIGTNAVPGIYVNGVSYGTNAHYITFYDGQDGTNATTDIRGTLGAIDLINFYYVTTNDAGRALDWSGASSVRVPPPATGAHSNTASTIGWVSNQLSTATGQVAAAWAADIATATGQVAAAWAADIATATGQVAAAWAADIATATGQVKVAWAADIGTATGNLDTAHVRVDGTHSMTADLRIQKADTPSIILQDTEDDLLGYAQGLIFTNATGWSGIRASRGGF
ncbi:MAG: hypothetical protein WC485_07775, partial [Opitutaceae bacterium]